MKRSDVQRGIEPVYHSRLREWLQDRSAQSACAAGAPWPPPHTHTPIPPRHRVPLCSPRWDACRPRRTTILIQAYRPTSPPSPDRQRRGSLVLFDQPQRDLVPSPSRMPENFAIPRPSTPPDRQDLLALKKGHLGLSTLSETTSPTKCHSESLYIDKHHGAAASTSEGDLGFTRPFASEVVFSVSAGSSKATRWFAANPWPSATVMLVV
jgi:hypothetical protein